MKKKVLILFFYIGIFPIISFSPYLAANLGIAESAALKAIDIIDAADNVMTILSLIAIVTGAGAISGGMVLAAKKLAKKVGKRAAAAW
ncbi:MAG: uberolysin/carnocyclin family circular bacteriocin [Lactobacillales bacterium]|jgi:circularin A/uberolysin family circular bacteriocin|nr:uberolysin/carnocyclin family circular bacteriocin [Lactobacillales bacterium]